MKQDKIISAAAIIVTALGCERNTGPWAPAALEMCPCLRQPTGVKAVCSADELGGVAVPCLTPVLSKLWKKPATVILELCSSPGPRKAKAVKTGCRSALGEAEGVRDIPKTGCGSALGEAEGVKDASGVAVLARALEEALQAHKGALLGLAARLLEVLPPLDLHKVVGEDLQGDQRVCSSRSRE